MFIFHPGYFQTFAFTENTSICKCQTSYILNREDASKWRFRYPDQNPVEWKSDKKIMTKYGIARRLCEI